MQHELTLTIQCWRDGGWIFGQIAEYPAVISQGRDVPELLANLADAAALAWPTTVSQSSTVDAGQ